MTAGQLRGAGAYVPPHIPNFEELQLMESQPEDHPSLTLAMLTDAANVVSKIHRSINHSSEYSEELKDLVHPQLSAAARGLSAAGAYLGFSLQYEVRPKATTAKPSSNQSPRRASGHVRPGDQPSAPERPPEPSVPQSHSRARTQRPAASTQSGAVDRAPSSHHSKTSSQAQALP